MKDQLPSMFYASGLLQVQGKKIGKKRKRSMVNDWLTNDMRTMFKALGLEHLKKKCLR